MFLYCFILGWKISVEQQLSNIQINKIKGVYENVDGVYDNVRTAAMSLFEQYLTEKSEQKIDLNPSLVQTLYFRIKNLDEPPSELWFDDVQNAVYETLKVSKISLFLITISLWFQNVKLQNCRNLKVFL